MADFVLKIKFFEFNGEVKRQRFESPYACIFMDEVETEFLKSQDLQPFVWLPYTDDTFFIWTDGEEKLTHFLNKTDNFHSNLKLHVKLPAILLIL